MSKKPESPEVYEEHGQLFRNVQRTAADGETWTQKRPVARTLDDAKRYRQDWFHPEIGWILEGYKLEKDRDAADIFADGSAPATGQPDLEKEYSNA